MHERFAWWELCPGRMLGYWPLNAGGDSDSRKYRVLTTQGSWFVKQEKGDRTKRYDLLMELLDDAHYACPVSVRYDEAIDSTACCVKWIDGIPLTDIVRAAAPEALPGLIEQAGDLLHRLHQIGCHDVALADDTRADWNAHRGWLFKLDLESARRVVCFADAQMELLPSRRLCLTHQDFRTDNIIMRRNGNLVLIDFSAASFSDPHSDYADFVMLQEHHRPLDEDRFLCTAIGGTPERKSYRAIGLYGCIKLLRYEPLNVRTMPSQRQMLEKVFRWLCEHELVREV